MLLFGAFMLMALVLASLYYWQEYTRLGKELALEAQLEYIECMRLKLTDVCTEGSVLEPDMQGTTHNILSVFGLLFLMFVPIGIFLSFFSVRPVRQASQMIDSFIANIVHDINTPISTLLLNTKSLLKNDTLAKEKLARMLASSEQLRDMQHDLLALADEKNDVESHTVEMKDLIQEIVEDFKLKHPAQKFVLSLSDYTLSVNRVDMRRILQNLLSNAIKYNQDTQAISLMMTEATLVIKDKGKGMKHPEKAFKRNYREDYSIQGNGIGLASVMAMLERNQIGILVSSALGQGTAITLYFRKTLERKHTS